MRKQKIIHPENTTPLQETDLSRIGRFTTELEKRASRPFEPLHDEVELCSFKRSFANLTNAILGCGILGLPYGLRKAGLSAIVLLGYTAWSVGKSYKFLVCTFHIDADMDKRQLRFDYIHVAYAVFGFSGEVAVGVMASLLYIMVGAQFLALCGKSLESISSTVSYEAWIAISVIIVILLILAVPNMKDMSWLGAVGIFNTILCVVTIMLISVPEIAKDLRATLDGLAAYPIFILDGFLLTLPLYLTSFGAVFAIPPLYNAMQNKSRFPLLVNLVYFLIVVCKAIFTITAFAAFQSDTRDIVSLNIESHTARGIISISIAVDKLLTLPIVIYSTRRQIETHILKFIFDDRWRNERFLNVILRGVVASLILTVSASIAIVIPNFAIITSLCGTIFGFGISMIIPITSWFVLARRKSTYDSICALVILVISCTGIVGGLYSNILHIRKLHQ